MSIQLDRTSVTIDGEKFVYRTRDKMFDHRSNLVRVKVDLRKDGKTFGTAVMRGSADVAELFGASGAVGKLDKGTQRALARAICKLKVGTK